MYLGNRYYKATYGGSPDGAVALLEWYCSDEHTRAEIVAAEEYERELSRRAVEECDRRLDTRNPLMARFTKRVIAALAHRVDELFAASVQARVTGNEREADKLYWQARDVADIKSRYQERLNHYRRRKPGDPDINVWEIQREIRDSDSEDCYTIEF